MTKPIIQTPDSVLTKKAQTVTRFDASLKHILSEMKQSLITAVDPVGVGLAAPQIGYSLRIFAIKPAKNSRVWFFINPKIITSSIEEIEIPKDNAPLEGCLSVDNTWGVVRRKKEVTIEYQDINGNKVIKSFIGFPAVIIQHEIDHLNGILFTQRVLEQKGKLFEIVKDKEGKNTLKELPL